MYKTKEKLASKRTIIVLLTHNRWEKKMQDEKKKIRKNLHLNNFLCSDPTSAG